MWIDRQLSEKIKKIATSRPALLLVGPRQVGKSSLLKHLFPEAAYVTFDHFQHARHAEENPFSFLSQQKLPVILDEIQYVPSLLREIKILIDQNRFQYGDWLLTGSQKFQMMQNAGDSLAGRMSILNLSSLCFSELKNHPQAKDLLWLGGYPELWAKKDLLDREDFFYSYIQSYLERDLRSLIQVSDLRDFQRFIKIAATRVGQLLNFSDIAKDIGVSQVTIKKWICALEISGIISILPPYYKNLGKRLIKTPKMYFMDNGLLCFLLGIQEEKDLMHHSFVGSIWENYAFTELVKSYGHTPGIDLFYYRDQNQVEVDFIVESRGKHLLIEAKYAQKPDPKKLVFHKVTDLFDHPKCFVMAPIDTSEGFVFKDYSIFNPLLALIGFQ